MSDRPPLRADDPAYVRYQYADDEKLRIRKETHQKYGEGSGFQEWVVHQVDAIPGLSLLDIGSGTGEDYHPLFPGVDIVAVDLSLGMLAKVRAKRVNADAQTLPFTNGAFDRVMANHMLYHAIEDVDLVASVFPNVRVVELTDAFVFPSAEPVFRYLATGPASVETEEQRQRLFGLMRPRIEEIIRREGAFRVPKTAGCFSADVD